MDTFYLHVNDQQTGPFTIGQLQHMWRTGQVNAQTLYWQEGFDEWIPLSTLADSLEAPKRSRTISYADYAGATEKSGPENPPSFAIVVIFTILFPIVGLIAGIVWLCNPRYRGAGGAILAIAFIVMFLFYAVFSRVVG